MQRQAQQLPGATHCPPRGHLCLGGVTPGGKVVEGAAEHVADEPNVHPRESCAQGCAADLEGAVDAECAPGTQMVLKGQDSLRGL